MNQNYAPIISVVAKQIEETLNAQHATLVQSLILDAQDVSQHPTIYAAGLVKQCIRKGQFADAAIIAALLYTQSLIEHEANARHNAEGQPSAETLDRGVEPEPGGDSLGAPVGDGSGDEDRPGLND